MIIAAYVICAVLTAIAAIFFAMYTRSISPSSHGNFYELYAIAAAVLGGCSLRGGEGSIIGIVLGAILLQVLQNLVNLLGIPSSLNFAVMGSVILIGVLADQQFSGGRLGRRKALAERRSHSRSRRALKERCPIHCSAWRAGWLSSPARPPASAMRWPRAWPSTARPVVVNARSAGKVEEAVATLTAAGHTVAGSVFDVTDDASVVAEVERIENEIGPIDILVNNAGIQHRAPLEDFPEDKWQQLLQTNISGVFHVGKAVAQKR